MPIIKVSLFGIGLEFSIEELEDFWGKLSKSARALFGANGKNFAGCYYLLALGHFA